ncbi:MAG: hypothetical protein H6838_00540 [Planctomycetes bacterium]|nr:hypothetical protein [Planctomycetota bacterium]MCB9883942.1 hypothetical protein [Planctomycetota bacterium]
MDDPRLKLKKLIERALAKGGDLPLALLLEQLAPVKAMRELARKFGASPKGGYRIERAPANVLAPMLAEAKDPEQLGEVLALLLPRAEPVQRAPDAAAAADAAALLALREQEVRRLQKELDKAREGAARYLDRSADLQQKVDAAAREQAVLRRELDELKRAKKAPGAAAPGGDRALQNRVHDLEGEREGLLAADAALRRQRAHDQTRLRQLEEVVAELEPLVPKNRRRKKLPPPPEPEPEKRFRLPRFLPSFYKSLDGKDRKSVERAFAAILLFCTEGHGYPGLEVKQLGGQDTWSFRASLGLRVYFRPLPEGDIELLELADREEQHTTLRRLKEK